ncbi:MAG TPA: hypothetical protein VGK30_12350 [Candidatus Binatia bacterium]|jgi:hypothetical protein
MRIRTAWFGAAAAVGVLAIVIASCGGTGGGSGHGGNPGAQFVLNSNNSGRLMLIIDPSTVDANKSDRIGLVATLTDNLGNPISGIVITFSSDIKDISFIPGQTSNGINFGQAVTDAHGNADIIAVAGVSPTSTGAIVGTGAIFAEPPSGFGLRAQASITLLDVGFVDAAQLGVIPVSETLVEPAPGSVVFFSVVGGTPPYALTNETSGVGTAVISQHCLPGCTEDGGILCIGSPCQSDVDCGVGSPSGTCIGKISRCLASCAGSNCAGARCEVDADCNDGSPTPANVCKDSGQSIAYIVTGQVSGTAGFEVNDSAGASVEVMVTVSFVCGNGVARGDEQCDLGDLRGQTCQSLGFPGGGVLQCSNASGGTDCTFDTSNCQVVASPSPGAGATFTPGGGVTTPTPTPGGAGSTATATPTPASTATPGIGVPSNLALALLTNCAGDNGNGTVTTVVAATVTDTLANPVPNGTTVNFSIASPTNGAIINSPSTTNADAPCDVSNFQSDCSVTVLDQPGVANTCITYPSGQIGTNRTVMGVSGAANDTQPITLPAPPP